jgi:signal transduction histidine kinase
MSEPQPLSRREEWLEFWERRELPVLRAMPYVLLALCVVFDIAARHGIDSRMLRDAALALGAAAVMATIDRFDRRTSWTEMESATGTRWGALLLVVLVALSAALVISQPLYGFYAWTGYLWSWRLLGGRSRLAGVAAVAVVVAISQTGAGPYHDVFEIGGLIVVYLVNACVASAISWFGWIGNEQQERRAQEVSALTEANAKLEQSLRQNAGLQEQLLTQAREAGVSGERRRMAREIHDTLAQGLMGIITQLQAAQRAGVNEQAATRHVELAIGLARESLTEARRSVQCSPPTTPTATCSRRSRRAPPATCSRTPRRTSCSRRSAPPPAARRSTAGCSSPGGSGEQVARHPPALGPCPRANTDFDAVAVEPRIGRDDR